MTDLFDRLAPKLLSVEGGYTDDPKDSGGKTNFGITEAVARENGYNGDMRYMTRTQALAIYRSKYWVNVGLAQVATLSEAVAAELFDTGVNMGQKVAGKFLQRALNVFNREGADYDDLLVDGDVGPATLRSLRRFLSLRSADGAIVLVRALNAMQGARYLEIAEGKSSQERFTFGWFLHRVS